jgi:hypothetical protein
MSQQIIARWTNPTHDKDGNAYSEADHDSYAVTLDGGSPIRLPMTWGTCFDLGSLTEALALKAGTHTATLAAKSKKGVTGLVASATFSTDPTPAAVGNFSITTG